MRKLYLLMFLVLAGCNKQTCPQYCANQGMVCSGISSGQHIQLSNGRWAHASRHFQCARTPESSEE